jgi:uncharacterized phage protein (TIGR02218 family)
MATFAANLESTEQKAIPELYKIERGSDTFRYTSYSSGLYFQGEYYEAATIARGSLHTDVKLAKITMVLSTPLTDEMKDYIPKFPILPTTVTVYRARIDDLSEYSLLISGRIVSIQIKEQQVNAVIEAKSKTLSRKIPRIVYQSFCNHDVFDAGCKLDGDLWKVETTITAISANRTYMDLAFQGGVWSEAYDKYFTGGRVVFGDDMRLITGHIQGTHISPNPHTIVLHIPFDYTLEVGAAVTVYPGCDGNPNTCLDKFGNYRNFLGFPTIPDHNPVIWGFR